MRTTFNNVVGVNDPTIREQIHENYRLTFLRDNVLASELDEDSTANLSTQIFLRNVNLAYKITANSEYMSELVRKFRSQSLKERKDAVLFLTDIFSSIKAL